MFVPDAATPIPHALVLRAVEDLDMLQEDLALRLGVDGSSLSRWRRSAYPYYAAYMILALREGRLRGVVDIQDDSRG